jgi:hypothetical protein
MKAQWMELAAQMGKTIKRAAEVVDMTRSVLVSSFLQVREAVAVEAFPSTSGTDGRRRSRREQAKERVKHRKERFVEAEYVAIAAHPVFKEFQYNQKLTRAWTPSSLGKRFEPGEVFTPVKIVHNGKRELLVLTHKGSGASVRVRESVLRVLFEPDDSPFDLAPDEVLTVLGEEPPRRKPGRPRKSPDGGDIK